MPIRNAGYSVGGGAWRHTSDERERLLAEARTAHREADRERNRARKLAARLARKLHHTLNTARAQLDAERAALDARVAKFNATQSEFNATAAVDRDRQRAAWADLAARQKRLAAEHEETNRFQAEQAAALDSRTAELAAREKADNDAKAKLQRTVAALHQEAAALDARARTTRQLVEELEQRRAELQDAVLAPKLESEPPGELLVALDRAADRDLGRLAAELAEREQRLNLERAAVQGLFAGVSADKATLADRRRVLSEQFAQLALARAQWQEAERATVAEMEQLAPRSVGARPNSTRREARLSRRRPAPRGRVRFVATPAAAGSVAVEARRLRDALAHRARAGGSRLHPARGSGRAARIASDARAGHRPRHDPVRAGGSGGRGPARDADRADRALREELERMAVVLLEADLPEPPDPPDSELPWGADDAPVAAADDSDDSDSSDVLLFDPTARAA